MSELVTIVPGQTTKRKKRKWAAKKTAVIVYADDVSIFITSKDEDKIICEAIKCYEKATGAKLIIEKSNVLAVGNWATSCDAMGIPYKEEITVLVLNL
jgi:hypothetical protein